MKRLLLTVMTMVALNVGAVWAGPYDEGNDAFNRGDFAAAAKQFRLVAVQGDARGQAGLCTLYEDGSGVSQDYTEAVKWCRLAAAQGNWAAQIDLCRLYIHGKGIPQDYVRAHMWCNLASALPGSESNSRSASGLRDALSTHMTPEQIAEAQKLARDCRQRNFKDCD
jgi:TPR repeat protein